MLTQIKELNEIILSKISKTDPFYEALIGKERFTPAQTIEKINDYNCGAVANVLEYLTQYVKDITKPLYEIESPWLDIIIFFLIGSRSFPLESESDQLHRMESILVREDLWRSQIWGVTSDIINVFSYYFPRELIYYIENHVLVNDLINGSFEEVLGGEWDIQPSPGVRSRDYAFSGEWGFGLIEAASSMEQGGLGVIPGAYCLNSFVKALSGPPTIFPTVWEDQGVNPEDASYVDTDTVYSKSTGPIPASEIKICTLFVQRDSDNFYYDFNNESWTADSKFLDFTGVVDKWLLFDTVILVDGSYNLSIRIDKATELAIDRIEFGRKEYPCFELLISETGINGNIQLFAGSVTNEGEGTEAASYINSDSAMGSTIARYSEEFYQELLDSIRPAGVCGIFKREVKL